MPPSYETTEPYGGFEQGPIRPPSEALSLLIRVARNCPWNRCTFCPLYKDADFSRRPVDHVKRDIDQVREHLDTLQDLEPEALSRTRIQAHLMALPPEDAPAFYAAYNWLVSGGLRSVFLHDSNSLILDASELADILRHLRERFPAIERVTSYARSHTIATKEEEELALLADAGLNRIHIGLESGSDEVLASVRKGATKALHIEAGLKVKAAGIQLSEYVMPGLGGQRLSETHALETADALNRINPDFIRLRTLAIPPGTPLYDDYQAGRFHKCTGTQTAAEILRLLEHLHGIASTVKSDHILNLFMDLEGQLPHDHARMLRILHTFLALPPTDQLLYQVGRRTGTFHTLDDMQNPKKLATAERTCQKYGITEENLERVLDELMRRFI